MTATGLYNARHGNRSTALLYILNRTGTRVPVSYPVGYLGNELPDNDSPSILIQRKRIATTVTRNFPILAAHHLLIHEIAYHLSRNFASSCNLVIII